MTTTQITSDFIRGFLAKTEKKWSNHKINNGIYGFQFQPGTKWNPGLSKEEIDAYQAELKIQFPTDFIAFLKHANGTNLQTVNVFGNDGNPHAHAPGVYSYPRDLKIIKQRIEWLKQDWNAALECLELDDEIFGKNPKFIPFYSHRYILSGLNPQGSIVCSIDGTDAIIYGASLTEYLQAEFLS